MAKDKLIHEGAGGVVLDPAKIKAEAALDPKALKFPDIAMQHGYVLFQPIIVRKTPEGIYLPDKVDRENKNEGIVVAVGPGRLVSGVVDGKIVCDREPVSCKKGDRVVVDPVNHAIIPVTIGRVDYIAIMDIGVMAVLPPLMAEDKAVPAKP